ncbi:SOLUTE CARRIER PROTEIN FAMILY 11 MEMBER [Salix koriyanagi]|uniref:SOLUTE CARRIER PROTEIN FAMILY 11 MEMBER n=1 Tax=Salix koriyanagi TaxID=2511006 RepID=A0A9Q0X402_9ROSI|nr:SOLUTE CARRIER PROTEIN FAMILY 11 MEMBER [Salix koriyanagi]
MISAANVFYSTRLVILTFPDAMNRCSGVQLDIPNWLQRATFRIIAVVPALYCVWTSGVEGIYQLLILTQVMVALLLPSSVIPLFRVASSRQVMGVYKISPFLEFVALVSFMGVLGINIIFVVEMIFGDSDWLPPLKSATRLDAQAWNWDVQNAVSEPSMLIEEDFFTENKCTREELIERQEKLSEPEKSYDSYSDITVANADPDLPEKIMETDQECHLTTIKDKHSEVTISSFQTFYEEETLPTIESSSLSAAVNLVPDAELLVAKKANIETMDSVEKTVDIDDGPGSFRSLSGKSDEGGNGAGSLSRLAGLGRCKTSISCSS